MAYATVADLVKLHSQQFLDSIADRDDDGNVDPETVQTALDVASAEIDSRLSVRYKLPLEEPPLIVQIAAIEIAVYRLANDGNVLTDDIRKRYEDMVSLLKDIAAGKANLGDSDLDDGAEEGDLDFRAPTAMFGTVSRI